METVSLDATDSGAVQRLSDTLGDSVRVLHYNAAAMHKASIFESSVETLNVNIGVDVGGALAFVKYFAPGMEKRGAGTILLTGGAFALSPNAEYLSLSIGKAAIRCMAEALFVQLSAKGIHIATLTVAAIVQHGSEEANAAADASGTSIRKRQEAGPGKRLSVQPREGIPPAWLCASRPPLGN